MKKNTFLLFFVFSMFLQAQENKKVNYSNLIITSELALGKILASNTDFPESKMYKQFLVSISKIKKTPQDSGHKN